MKSKIGLITLGVQDVAKAKAFYKALGFQTHGEDKEDDTMVMFKSEGTWLGLYPWDELAKDAQVETAGTGFRGVTLAHLEPTKADVDRVINEARALGAKVIKEPQDVFWGGYSGYFSDIDGHLWEIAMNPFTDLT
ncbi:MAG: VOC family protein [Patescibacteria group bacterium]